MLLDTIVAGALTAVAIFSSGFYSFFENFQLFVIIWIGPWVAIFITDWFMRRGRYDSRSLLTGRAGIYWRNGGLHLPGVVAQVVGMLAAASWLDTTVWQGPLSKATHMADFSVLMGAIFGAGVYYLLARRSIPREAVRPPPRHKARAGECHRRARSCAVICNTGHYRA